MTPGPEEFAREAAKPNPALSAFAPLVGNWRTAGSHPGLRGVSLHGRASFAWTLGGAFLLLRSEIDEPGIPSGLAIIGSDDATARCYMLYFDERGVSRQYEVEMRGNVWRWWREAPGFSQRYAATLSPDGRTMVGHGDLSRDGVTWEDDLQLAYTRIDGTV